MASAIVRAACLRRWLLVSLICLAGGVSSTAFAHPEWSPIRVNRYLKLSVVDGEPPAIVYTLLYGDGPALPARKSVDADANGKIDPTEKAMLGTRAAAAISAGLKLEIDGVAEVLRPASIDVGLAGDEVTTQPLSVDVRYEPTRLSTPGPHQLHIDDRVEVPNEGDSEISVFPPNARALTAAYRGPTAPTTGRPLEEPLFTFRGPRFSALEDRSVTLVLGQAAPTGMRLPRWSFVVGVLALALAAYLAIRRRS